jgi:hypothetical protein
MTYETHPFLTIYRVNSLQWNSVDQVTYFYAVKKMRKIVEKFVFIF